MGRVFLYKEAGIFGLDVDRNHLRRLAKRELIGRRSRKEVFGSGMLRSAAWDMLLVLYTTENERRLTVGRLANLSETAPTSAIRWLRYLVEEQLLDRESSPVDNRVVFVRLSDKGRSALDSYFYETFTREA